MQAWISIKESVALWSGIDHDALLVLASVLLSVGASLVSRRPLSSPVPWLLVLAVALGNEAISALADGSVDAQEWWPALRDLSLVLAVPTALLVLGRYAPRILSAPQDRRILLRAAPDPKWFIADGEFEEIARPKASS